MANVYTITEYSSFVADRDIPGCVSLPIKTFEQLKDFVLSNAAKDSDALDLMKLSIGNLSDEEINALYEREEELSSRKYVLYSLCAEGCITTEKLLTLTNEIDRKSEEIKRKLSFLEKQSAEMIKELGELYRIIKTTSSAGLAEKILKNAVSDGRTIEFELSGGLKFREVLS